MSKLVQQTYKLCTKKNETNTSKTNLIDKKILVAYKEKNSQQKLYVYKYDKNLFY